MNANTERRTPPANPPDVNRGTNSTISSVETKTLQQPAAASTARNLPLTSPDNAEHVQVPQAPSAANVDAHLTTVDPGAKELQPDISEKLWNDAYDSLEKDEDKLVEAYRSILAELLVDEKLKDLKAEKATDASPSGANDILAERDDLRAKILEELKDRSKREIYMNMLVESGKAKVAKSSKITKAVDTFAKAILPVKPIVDSVIEYTPQAAPAALPWAGVCFGLQVSNNLITASVLY